MISSHSLVGKALCDIMMKDHVISIQCFNITDIICTKDFAYVLVVFVRVCAYVSVTSDKIEHVWEQVLYTLNFIMPRSRLKLPWGFVLQYNCVI